MATSLSEQFDRHVTWRREFALRLKLLAEWMKDHELLDASARECLRSLEAGVRADQVTLAFVGESSRGKSELINALFFPGQGRCVMPAGAGRATRCPTEIGYHAELASGLRLLPMETRRQPQALLEWRKVPEQWTHIEVDENDPKQLSLALETVTETLRVTPDEARALGFWQVDAAHGNPPLDAQGLVEVPKWRQALINIAHPLLKQGLVILDTPGLNAIGVEPELAVNLIPQAQAIVFVLAADTGVTKSDLAVWRDHLVTESDDRSARLAVLNKIDTLWDALDSAAQVAQKIERQRAATAESLGLPKRQVIPVSAQRGLLAKMTDDLTLLEDSGLTRLEDVLGQGIVSHRQKMLSAAVLDGISDLREETGRIINIRRRDLTEQMMELKGLQGKAAPVINNMRARILQEQAEFELSGAKIHALRSVHLKLLRETLSLLSRSTLKKEMTRLAKVLQQERLKLGVKQAYAATFEQLREGLRQVQASTAEIQVMLAATFRQLNAQHGFSLRSPPAPSLDGHLRELDLVERAHLRYMGLGNLFRLAQPGFADRLVRALFTRLRALHEAALGEVELWSKSAAAQLDAQLRERRLNFTRRLGAIDRVLQAAGGLEEQLVEIAAKTEALRKSEAKWLALTDYWVTATDRVDPALAPASELV